MCTQGVYDPGVHRMPWLIHALSTHILIGNCLVYKQLFSNIFSWGYTCTSFISEPRNWCNLQFYHYFIFDISFKYILKEWTVSKECAMLTHTQIEGTCGSVLFLVIISQVKIVWPVRFPLEISLKFDSNPSNTSYPASVMKGVGCKLITTMRSQPD